MPEELQNFLGGNKDENVSVLHLNIKSINKNSENFQMFLWNLNFSFSIICFSETWLNDSNVDNSSYDLPNYVSIHQIRNHSKRAGGCSVYIHKDSEFKIRNDLSINSKDNGSISMELLHVKWGNTLFIVVYRLPSGKIEPFENFFKILFNKKKAPIKIIILQEISILTSQIMIKIKKFKIFFNLIYQNGMISTINKPTIVTKKLQQQ